MNRVAVIGAGVSGLACAKVLASAGTEVVVFEKSRSLGGRCSSRRWEGCVFDHGAQFFTARDESFRAWLGELGDRVRAVDGEVVDASNNEVGSGSRRYYHVEGNNRLGRELAAGLEVRSETLIERVGRGSDSCRWEVGGENFDGVVSCAPWPQTAAMLGIEPGPSPYERNLTAAFLYDTEWSGRAREIYAVSDRSGAELAWSACENHKVGRVPDGRTLFVVQSSADFSVKFFDAEREAWADRLQVDLERRWGLDAARRLGVFTHRWGFSRRVADVGAVDLPDSFYVCGDSWSESRIEDAWLSGRAVARRAIEWKFD
ncbi:MAG: FAD-dependent oxidoreductase [Chthoniobacterales bacterium]